MCALRGLKSPTTTVQPRAKRYWQLMKEEGDRVDRNAKLIMGEGELEVLVRGKALMRWTVEVNGA